MSTPPLPPNNNAGDNVGNGNIPPAMPAAQPGISREDLLREWLTRRIQLVHAMRVHHPQLSGLIPALPPVAPAALAAAPAALRGAMDSSTAMGGMLNQQYSYLHDRQMMAAMNTAAQVQAGMVPGISNNISHQAADILRQRLANVHAQAHQAQQPPVPMQGQNSQSEHQQATAMGYHALARAHAQGPQDHQLNYDEGSNNEINETQQQIPSPHAHEPAPGNSAEASLKEALKKKIMQKIQDKLRALNPEITQTEQARAMEHLLEDKESQSQVPVQPQAMPHHHQDFQTMLWERQQQLQHQSNQEFGSMYGGQQVGDVERQQMLDTLYRVDAGRSSHHDAGDQAAAMAMAQGESGPPQEISFPRQHDGDSTVLDISAHAQDDVGPSNSLLVGNDGEDDGGVDGPLQVGDETGVPTGAATSARAPAGSKDHYLKSQTEEVEDIQLIEAAVAGARAALKLPPGKKHARSPSKLEVDERIISKAKAQLKAQVEERIISKAKAQLKAQVHAKDSAPGHTDLVSQGGDKVPPAAIDKPPPAKKRKKPLSKEEKAKQMSTKLDEIIDNCEDVNIKTTLKEDRENIQARRKEKQQMYEDRIKEMESRLDVYAKLEGLAEQIAEVHTQSKVKNSRSSSSKSNIEGALDMIHLSYKNYRMLEGNSDRLLGIEHSAKSYRK